MAEQTFLFSEGDDTLINSFRFQAPLIYPSNAIDGALQINESLLSSESNENIYLGDIFIETLELDTDLFVNSVRLDFYNTVLIDDLPVAATRDLTNAWESYREAIQLSFISSGVENTLIIPGPNSETGNVNRDSTIPYRWSIETETSQIQDWFSDLTIARVSAGSTGAVTYKLVLFDGVEEEEIIVGAKQTFDIPAASFITESGSARGHIRWSSRDTGPVIDGAFLADGQSAILARFYLQLTISPPRADASDWLQFNTYRVGQDRTSGGDPGPEMSDAWERSPRAITIRHGDMEVVWPGPTHPDSATFTDDDLLNPTGPGDDTEPYQWFVAPGLYWPTLYNYLLSLTPEQLEGLTLTIDNGIDPTPVRLASDFTTAIQGSATLNVDTFNVRLSADLETSIVGSVNLYSLPIALEDIDLTGYQTPVYNGLIRINNPQDAPTSESPGGGDLSGGSAGSLELIQGSLEIASDLTITELERRSNNIPGERLQFRATGSGSFLTYWNPDAGAEQLYPGIKLLVRTSRSSQTLTYYLVSTGASFTNWRLDDVSQASITNSLVDGDYLAFAFAQRVNSRFSADFETAIRGSATLNIDSDKVRLRLTSNLETAVAGTAWVDINEWVLDLPEPVRFNSRLQWLDISGPDFSGNVIPDFLINDSIAHTFENSFISSFTLGLFIPDVFIGFNNYSSDGTFSSNINTLTEAWEQQEIALVLTVYPDSGDPVEFEFSGPDFSGNEVLHGGSLGYFWVPPTDNNHNFSINQYSLEELSTAQLAFRIPKGGNIFLEDLQVSATVNPSTLTIVDPENLGLEDLTVTSTISAANLRVINPGILAPENLRVTTAVSAVTLIHVPPDTTLVVPRDLNVSTNIPRSNLTAVAPSPSVLQLRSLNVNLDVNDLDLSTVAPDATGIIARDLKVTTTVSAINLTSIDPNAVIVNPQVINLIVGFSTRPALEITPPAGSSLVTTSLTVDTMTADLGILVRDPDPESVTLPQKSVTAAVPSVNLQTILPTPIELSVSSPLTFNLGVPDVFPSFVGPNIGVGEPFVIDLSILEGGSGKFIHFGAPQIFTPMVPVRITPREDTLTPADYRYDLSKLLTRDLRSKAQWRDMAEVLSRVFFQYIYNDIQGIINISDISVLQSRSESTPIYQIRHERGRTLNRIQLRDESVETLDRNLLGLFLNNLGFSYFSDSISAQEYKRLLESYGIFTTEKASLEFLDFIGYFKNINVEVNVLWTADYQTFVKRDEVPSGQSLLDSPENAPVYYPTPHLELIVDSNLISNEEVLGLFRELAPTHLVLERIGAEIPLLSWTVRIIPEIKTIQSGIYRALPKISVI